jgi:hypothetical protein
MNILYLIGILALGICSVVVLPIIVVVFFVGVAGLIAPLERRKMSRKLSPRFRTALGKRSAGLAATVSRGQ